MLETGGLDLVLEPVALGVDCSSAVAAHFEHVDRQRSVTLALAPQGACRLDALPQADLR